MLLINCSSHVMFELSNIVLSFMPPNTSSLIQPLDMGIIKTFKDRYRNCLMNHIMDTWKKDYWQSLKHLNVFVITYTAVKRGCTATS